MLTILAIHASPLLALAGGVALGVMGRGRFSQFMQNTLSGEGREERKTRRQESKRQQERQQMKDALEKDYVKGKGWNLLAFPADMKGNVNRSNDKEMFFNVAGAEDFVKGSVKRDGSVEYAFVTRNIDEARRAKEKLGMFNGTVKMQDLGDAWLFTSDKAAAINSFAKEVYPQRKVNVERLDTEVKQYTVHDCKTYEEAVEKLRKNPDLFHPVHSYHELSNTIDGVTVKSNVGYPLDEKFMSSMPLGCFLVEMATTDAYKGQVTIPSALGLDAEGEKKFADLAFVSDKDSRWEEKCSVEAEYKDVTPKDVSRFSIDDSDCILDIYNDETAAKQMRKDGFKAYVVCDSLREATDLVADGKIPANSLLIVDREKPQLGDGQFAVSVPIDSDMLSRLALQGEASPSHAANFQNYGLNARDLEVSTMYDQLDSNGYGTFRVKDGIDISKGKVNGLSVDEFAGRVVNGRLMNLNDEQMNQWLKDASMVQSVTITVDKKNAELQITSVVNNTQLIEKRKLTDKELSDFVKRGEVSKAEMKDLLLQMHPEYFKTYSVNGKGLFKDPVTDFLKGQKPKADQTLLQSQKKVLAQKKAQTQAVKQTQAPKPAKKTQMKIG